MARRRSLKELENQSHRNGYRRGAHEEDDKIKRKDDHVTKTVKEHDRTLLRYLQWQLIQLREDCAAAGRPTPTEEDARAVYLRNGVDAPDLATIKDFFRFYISTSTPQNPTDKPTADSINSIAEFFFAGFERVTGTAIHPEERCDVYNWVRTTLVLEDLVTLFKKPKYTFQKGDLSRLLLTLWTQDDPIFIHERSRIQFTFILRVFCWTGARIGAFFTDGLRYRDLTLVLIRTKQGPAFIYRVDQRWVKNNRDPANVVFGAAGKGHDRFIYDDISILLAMAIADNALAGFHTLADLQRQKIPPGKDHVPIRFRKQVLDMPILRQCTMHDGVTKNPMSKSAFDEILRATALNSGCASNITVHGIRRGLGKKVDEIYTEAQRSQHLTQADPKIFGTNYMANMSSVSGQDCFLEEPPDHRHVDFFQGYGQFIEPGLPYELPARHEEELRQDPVLQALETDLQACPAADPQRRNQLQQARRSYWKTLKQKATQRYRDTWRQERTDWYVATRGEEQADDRDRTDLFSALCVLIPERRRLAEKMKSNQTLPSEPHWLAVQDLYALCQSDSPVLYLNGLRPVHGKCPVDNCRKDLDRLPKRQRNSHVQACRHRELADQHSRSYTELHYCYHCFEWIIGDQQWDDHCRPLLEQLTSKTCGILTYRHTLVRPGYCPFCLSRDVSPGKRFQSWTRDHSLWDHIDTHVDKVHWPLACPHLRCNFVLDSEQDFRFHLMDEHGLSRTRLKGKSVRAGADPAQKRKATADDTGLSWMPHEQCSPTHPPKRLRSGPPTIAPALLSHVAEQAELSSPVIDLTASTFSPEVLGEQSENTSLTDETESHSRPSIRFRSADSTLVGLSPHLLDVDDEDYDFSQFIRSPTPELVAAAPVPKCTDVVSDVNGLMTNPEAGCSEAGMAHQDSEPIRFPKAPVGTRPPLRIHLRVTPLKTRINLRVSAPGKSQTHQPRRCSKAPKRRQPKQRPTRR